MFANGSRAGLKLAVDGLLWLNRVGVTYAKSDNLPKINCFLAHLTGAVVLLHAFARRSIFDLKLPQR